MDSVHNLNYRIIECTSEDLEFPVSELLKGIYKIKKELSRTVGSH